MSGLFEELALFSQYLTSQRHLSVLTVSAYRTDVEQYLSFYFAQSEHAEIQDSGQNAMIQQFFDQVRTRVSLSKLIRLKSALTAFFQFLYLEHVIPVPVTVDVILGKKPFRLPQHFSEDTLQTMFDQLPTTGRFAKRNRAILELLYGCGLRTSELLALTVLDFQGDPTLIKVIGKRQHERMIPLHSLALDAVQDYIQTERETFRDKHSSSALFLNKNGMPLSRNGLYRLTKHMIVSVSESGSSHTFRHSFATHLLDGNAPLRDVQALLGHRSITTTQHYTSVSVKSLKSVYKKAHSRS